MQRERWKACIKLKSLKLLKYLFIKKDAKESKRFLYKSVVQFAIRNFLMQIGFGTIDINSNNKFVFSRDLFNLYVL